MRELRIYKMLKGSGFSEQQSMSIAEIVAASTMLGSRYDQDHVIDTLCDSGFEEVTAESISAALRGCFASERFGVAHIKGPLKVSIVRAGIAAPLADAILEAIDPCVVAPRTNEVRAPILYTPAPGRVVMCDFTFLMKPEMQKVRRAIVISRRATVDPMRCTVVPVSMSPSIQPNPHHYEFAPGSYPFFHARNPVWAICYHIYTVALIRLWKININHRPELPQISNKELTDVRGLASKHLGAHP
jgi:uncharacterized protein YifN (PemK superfamily)